MLLKHKICFSMKLYVCAFPEGDISRLGRIGSIIIDYWKLVMSDPGSPWGDASLPIPSSPVPVIDESVLNDILGHVDSAYRWLSFFPDAFIST